MTYTVDSSNKGKHIFEEISGIADSIIDVRSWNISNI